MITLVKPDEKYYKQYKDMMDEWNMAGEKMLIMEGGDTTRENPTLNAKHIKDIVAKYVMQ